MTTTDKSTKPDKKPETENNGNDEDDRTVFVGNISEKVTDELLYELFLQGGPVEEISIPKDRETGKQKSFGFVRFKHAASVPYACDIFRGTRLFGRDLNIKSRNRDAGNNKPTHPEPRGLSSLVQGFHNNMPSMNMLPKMGMPPPVSSPMSMIDPIFLQSLATANPYGDMKFGEYNAESRNSYKDRHPRRRHDDKRYDDRDSRDRHRSDNRGGERRTDKWKNNRR